MPHFLYILFLFALGACVGSFLNVVVWRLPREESLVSPPSHCPRCNALLKWYDNLPVIGWIKLGGKCRTCKQPISARYPIIEAITGGLFVFYYVMFFILNDGPCIEGKPYHIKTIRHDWMIYMLYMFAVSALLAASLIDAAEFFIPQSIPILLAVIGIIVHTFIDNPNVAGAVRVTSTTSAAIALGGAIGLLISFVLKHYKVLPLSFEHGWPLLEHERAEMQLEIEKLKREGKEAPELPPLWSRKQITQEMRKEMLFLMPPMAMAIGVFILTSRVPAIATVWQDCMRWDWLTGLLGSILGAMVGAFVVWLTRILGSLAFGREAMGMGDVDLMFGVGAVIGAGASTIAFFVAPFFGLMTAAWLFITGKSRELPYGPYLSMGAAFVMLYYCPIADYLRPGLSGLKLILTGR